MTLNELQIGQTAIVDIVGGEGALRQHFLDMGIIPGVEVTTVKFAPMGDPMEIQIHGYELTIRVDDAKRIIVTPASKKELADTYTTSRSKTMHPGLGEMGKFHRKEDGTPLPQGTKLTFALVGNQNCGKTTLFNQLTGANQHVGNFPGVTVDCKTGTVKGYPNVQVTDLPGIYSMSPYSSEEIVSRNFVLEQKPTAIINIVDATNIQRNLYLTMQLLEMNVPMVVALNMMDEVNGNGGYVDINAMEELLGIPVIPISAAKNQGIDELIKHAVHVAAYHEPPSIQDYCDKTSHNGTVHRSLHGIIHLIEDHAKDCGIPVRFAASKLVEGDKLVLEALRLDQNEKEMLEHIVAQMENERGLDRSAAMADMRFSYINKVCDRAVVKPKENKQHKRSQRLDRFLTGKFTAIPAFIVIMVAIFYLTFNVIGAWLQGLMEQGVTWITNLVSNWMMSANINEVLRSLVVDGILTGVGSVLSFLPIIVTLFFFLSLLEDSGYIARVAFVMDKLLRKIGLSGRSIVPMLIGFGCTVPAVMATRTLPSERDRKMTILLTPFMSCTAKLPIYAFFVNAFFPGNKGLIMSCLYLLGIVLGILIAFLYKNVLFRGEAVPFVMELPNYRLPSPKSVFQLLWEKAKDFMERAFTVILLASVAIWFLQSFDFRLNLVASSEDSMLAKLAGLIAPILQPIGLGDWRICTALISGFMAKESVVSTLEVLYSGSVTSFMTPLAAASLLVFSLLYTPCVAAIASVRRELGGKWALGVVVWQCVLAWIASFVTYWIGMAIGIV